MIVAKYKFDKSIYENLIPVFNDGYNGYTISDEIDETDSSITIRTIECDILPTYIRFGTITWDSEITNDVLSLKEIIDINADNLSDMSYMFCNCHNLNEVKNLNVTSATMSLQLMFYQCKMLIQLDLSNWDTSNVKNMQGVLQGCTSLINLDISNWDTNNVIDMNSAFRNCGSLSLLNLSNFNIDNVTKIGYMFDGCSSLITLDLSNWNTDKVTNKTNIFTYCPNLQYIRCNNTSTINTLASLLPSRTSSTQGKIITTSSTNVDTTTLSSLNWSVDTSSGTKIAEYKFDKSIWNSLVPEFNEGFGGYFVNDKIEDEVNSPNVVTRNLVGYGGLPTLMRFGLMWTEGESKIPAKHMCLTEVVSINGSGLTTCDTMFKQCRSLKKVSGITSTNNVSNMGNMFADCHNLHTLNLNRMDTSKVWNFSNMFWNCFALQTIDLSYFNTSNATRMENLFRSCNNLTSLDVSNFDTSNVTRMDYMFCGCNNLTSLDVSNWDTSKVTIMYYMFNNCTKLTSLDVSNWDVSNVTTTQSMFSGCIKLVSLDLSSWNTNKVTSMHNMFQYAPSLTTLDISNFVINASTDAYGILTGCNKLSDIGMLYCSQDTINKLIPLITDGSKTIWVKDTKASDYTATDYVTFKDYKEDNRTLYLNSPLLEGDEIVNKEGKLYHYHKMGKVVFDGSEKWITWTDSSNPSGYSSYYIYYNTSGSGHTLNIPNGTNAEVICDTFKHNNASGYASSSEGVRSINNYITFTIKHENLKISDSTSYNDRLAAWKSWLSKNPTTVVYELAEPYYELISDNPLIVKSYAEGKLDTSSIITPTSIQSIPYKEELTYLYTSTQYCIQFYSTADCTVDITLGGTKVENKSVSVGLNKIYITTPSTLVDNKLIINSKGNATISEVVVVNSNEEFDYFDGLKSSFEDCLVTDVDNENYGKYEVGVKIVGKNKFDGEVLDNSAWIMNKPEHSFVDGYFSSKNIISVKPNTEYRLSCNGQLMYGNIHYRDLEGNFIGQIYIQDYSNLTEFTSKTPNNCYYITFQCNKNNFDINGNIQLEEGDIATPYEPYKETNATIYLNSPLLQGDRIEVVDGKLCHYHKMGKVVFDGGEDENWGMNYGGLTLETRPNTRQFYSSILDDKTTGKCEVSDKFKMDNIYDYDIVGFCIYGNNINDIRISHTSKSVKEFKQWLSENPTTVVYELAEPYYEDITPIQSSFVISTVSEGDMEIITDLPIKSNITYLTNIASAVLMEQQLDELDNSTESLTNIVEDEINE